MAVDFIVNEEEVMLATQRCGGFSLDASVGIAAKDRGGLERLLRYCARPPFASERLFWLDEEKEKLIYRLPKPNYRGDTEVIVEPLELLGKVAKLISPAKTTSPYYHGAFAPKWLSA